MGQLGLVKLLMEGTWKQHSGMGKGLCFSSTTGTPSLGAVARGLQVRAEGDGQEAMGRVPAQSGTTLFCWKCWRISWQVGKFSLTQNSPLQSSISPKSHVLGLASALRWLGVFLLFIKGNMH